MAKVVVRDISGQEISEKELSGDIFSTEPNVDVMHAAVVRHLANCRQGTQSTKTRSEVRGGGRKPWRQKGSGKARQGSIRAPQWIHGGIVFAPKPRSYGSSINKKVKKLAIKSALSSKVLDSNLVMVDDIEMEAYSTKKFVEILNALNIKEKVLVVMSKVSQKVVKSAANLQKVKVIYVDELNVYDILNCDKLVMDLKSVEKIEEVYGRV